ncbi:MAG TPA: PAS domain-containing sensor histidine kinase, partial [Hyphomicrobiaceae bacterium]|nr:PAS domain-containing sensor histidine kinase [Hyphomicrobiaceae bacterium]
RLHVRVVALFSIIAVLPAILLAVAATITFSRSIDSWFSVRTRQIIEHSLDVANAYLEEHGQVIRNDVVNMAKDLDAAPPAVRADAEQFKRLVLVQASLRDLHVAYVINGEGNVVLNALEAEGVRYERPSGDVMRAAASGQIPIWLPPGSSRVAALAGLEKMPGSFLYVARTISPKVLSYLRRAQAGVAEYEQLRQVRGGVKVAHGLMYLMISLTALLVAIWIGLWFASRFVAPIGRIIGAAQQVSRGNLDVELPVIRGEGDLRRLSQTFNTMTAEIKTQRDALIAANEQLLRRRLFMEAVLSGVSAGVLGLDAQRRITLANRSAERLLGMPEAELVGRPLAGVVAEFARLFDHKDDEAIKPRTQHQVTRVIDGEERTFAVRITTQGELSGGDDQGTVVTFDDITELVSAQRTSAWADVARRIAHEIKNPLTPIQLSAERIRRKYSGAIQEDRDTFERLTETIVRQVGDIKSMVDEFASFARMPKPLMEEHDLREAIQEPVVLFREGHPGIDFELRLPGGSVRMLFDRRLITQAITNLVKNAVEAVQAVADGTDRPADYRGRVETSLKVEGDRAVIEVSDNGIGLAKHNRMRLLEPYVTTKAKGTGLGLAIVQKVVEQHGGVLALEDAPAFADGRRGALVRLILPIRRRQPAVASPAAAE